MRTFQEIAPRLFRAHQEQRRVIEERDKRRIDKRCQVLRVERLVAHRELQAVRALGSGDRRYMRKRDRLLREARRALEHVRSDLSSIDEWEPAWAR